MINDIRYLHLMQYINRRYCDAENGVVEIKNRMYRRDVTSRDYADLAMAYARQEAQYEILNDIMKILQKWR